MKIPQLPRGYNALTLYPTSETRNTIAPLRSDLEPDPQKGVMGVALFLSPRPYRTALSKCRPRTSVGANGVRLIPSQCLAPRLSLIHI